VDNIEILWRFPPSYIQLARNEIHLWCAPLNTNDRDLEELHAILSTEEQARASKFHFFEDQCKFIKSRALLRSILSFYVKKDAKDLDIQYTDSGKPFLIDSGTSQIQFNLTHSKNLVVVAVTRYFELGVDVETASRLKTDFRCVDQFLTLEERVLFEKAAECRKMEAFLNGWTRKEAFLKAIGCGLSKSPLEIEVTFLPEDPARYINIFGDPYEANYWLLQSIQPASGYIGAIACRQKGLRLECWRWPENGLSYFSIKNHHQLVMA